MKIIFTAIALMFITAIAVCQDVNDQLYQAVSAKDSLAVKSLLSNKADANFKKDSGGFLKLSMLILAVRNNDLNDVKLLVENHAEVEWRDAFDTTALMYAASKGNEAIVAYLIKNGANINAKDKQGNSVLSAAKESNNPRVIAMIKNLMVKN